MKYELIASDIDGTLLGRPLKLSERNRREIRRVISAGADFTFATGRTELSILHLVEELDLDTYLILHEGALIRHSRTRKTLLHRSLPLHLAREVIGRAKEHGLHLNYTVEDEVFIERHRPEVDLYRSISSLVPRIVGDLGDFAAAAPTKLVIVCEDIPFLDSFGETLKEKLSDRCHVTKSYPFFLEVVHGDVSKGKALRLLAEHKGVPREKVMAIGDSYNDLDMLEYAGLGVAMENAVESLKEKAGHITGPVEKDGVAQALARFV